MRLGVAHNISLQYSPFRCILGQHYGNIRHDLRWPSLAWPGVCFLVFTHFDNKESTKTSANTTVLIYTNLNYEKVSTPLLCMIVNR